MTLRLRFVWGLMVTAILSLASPAGAGGKGQPFQVSVGIAGPEEVVFDWSSQRCEDLDIPDLPARAFRDHAGRVNLLSSHHVNRRSLGPDLDNVTRDCRVIMRSHGDPDPARHNGFEWISSVYTADGMKVSALVHNEYHAYLYPGQCPSGDPGQCWYASVTAASSPDGGLTFDHAPPPTHLVASIPYRYVPDMGPKGLFSPSNIIFKDGFYYALVHVEEYGEQPWGTCLMRTQNLDDPTSWRAWDGKSFSVGFVNPYSPGGDSAPDARVCEPIARDNIQKMHESVTFNTQVGQYLLVGTAGAYSPQEGRSIWGIYYSLSDDLLAWTPMQLLMETPTTWSYQCGSADPTSYPSALDPASSSRNFETTGETFYVYFTRLNYEHCQPTLDRDLMRVPVKISIASPPGKSHP